MKTRKNASNKPMKTGQQLGCKKTNEMCALPVIKHEQSSLYKYPGPECFRVKS
jgi:hypothetical protein